MVMDNINRGQTPNKILVVNVNWIGDVLFSLPLLASLRKAFPEASLTCWVVPRCAELLESQPMVDAILLYDEKGKQRGWRAKYQFLRQLRAKGFDTVFLLHRSFSRTLLCTLAGIPERIGYRTWKRTWLLTHPVRASVGSPGPQDWIRHGKHKVEYFLDLARAVGIEVNHPWYEIHLDDGQKKRARDSLAKMGVNLQEPFIAVHPGANWDLKRWPPEFFSDLVGRFAQDDLQVLISGSFSDRSLIQKIIQPCQNNSRIWSLAGEWSLLDLAALFQLAQLVVANDTGPLHLASAVGTPVVALFGPTQPHLTGPYGKGAIRVLRKEVGCNEDPCYSLGCHENICMRAITVEEVWRTCRELLNGIKLSAL